MIPLRLELEYMLQQRRLLMDLATNDGFTLDETRLRQHLRHLGMRLIKEKRTQLEPILGKMKLPMPTNTLEQWIDGQVESIQSTVDAWHEQPRQDASDDDLIAQMMRLAKELSTQQESRASAAILQLNTETIEDIARGSGSSHYRWETQKDDRVRDWHEDLQSKTVSWNKPPMGGGTRKTDKGHPGSGYGCRCWPAPIASNEISRRPPKPKPVIPGAVKKAKPKLRPEREMETGYKGRLKSGMGVKEAEKSIATYKVEHGMAWDADGNTVLRKRGSKNQVDLTAGEVSHLRENAATFTHNHPDGAHSLSVGDVVFARHVDFTEIRAVAGSRGTRMIVTDKAKWLADPSSVLKNALRGVHPAAKAAGTAAQELVEAGLPAAQRAGIQEWRALLEKADAAYRDAYAKEATRQFNRVGENFGFRVEQF